jgi:hypothetical protein
MKLGEPPQFLNDLYRDLRDRHLLIPALGLLAAIVAVPFLLKHSAETPAPPPPAPAASADATAVEPAVLADDQVGVRDYRKRLAELKSKNPFHQQFVTHVDDTAAASTTDSTGSSSTSSLPDTSTGISSASSSPTSPATTTPVTQPPTGGNGGSQNPSGSNPSKPDVRVVHQLYTRRIKVLAGVQGDAKVHDNVKPMTILPDPTTPVVAFLGTDEGGKRAAFVVSSDVTAVGGDGACVPDPSDCLYITLQRGEQATLDYAPDGQTYEVKLLAIRNVKLKAD